MGVRRLLASASAAPLLLAALTGCGGGDSSVADPPVAPGTSSPTDPPRRESPEHFIRRWAAEERRMENTGQTADYLLLSSKCTACRQLASDIHRYYKAGGFVHWGGWRILSIRPRGANTFDVRVISAPTSFRTSAEAPTKHLAGGPATHQLEVRRVGGNWLVLAKAQLAT